jgi:hypothetical protein
MVFRYSARTSYFHAISPCVSFVVAGTFQSLTLVTRLHVTDILTGPKAFKLTKEAGDFLSPRTLAADARKACVSLGVEVAATLVFHDASRPTYEYWNILEKKRHSLPFVETENSLLCLIALDPIQSCNIVRKSHSFSFISRTFITSSGLRQVCSLFQSDFSIDFDLMLPLSISSILSFSLRSSSSCLHLLPRLHITSIFPSLVPEQRVLEGSSYEMCDQSNEPLFLLQFVGHSCFP